MNTPPTTFQKKALWSAITALSLTVIGVIAVGLIYGGTQVLALLQPFLVPFAIAGVLAYLLEPGVVKLERRGLSRQRAVLLVFAVFTLVIFSLGWWLGVKLGAQTQHMEGKLSVYVSKVRTAVVGFADRMEEKYGIELMPMLQESMQAATDKVPETRQPEASKISESKQAEPAKLPENKQSEPAKDAALPEPESYPKEMAEAAGAVGAAAVAVAGGAAGTVGAAGAAGATGAAGAALNESGIGSEMTLKEFLSGEWVSQALPSVVAGAWRVVRSSLGGVLGAFGFLLSMIIIPLYLYYFLIESAKIKETWAEYLPLRASSFKDEVADCLTEINHYLVAFFRGQLFVSVVNGVMTGIGLMIVGLDFGLLIGLMLCVLGIIPYLGIALCWVPAVAIAAVQGGSGLVPGDPWWMLPLVVTIIFAVVQQIDGFFLTPKVVGESVGLHPMTVIVSVVVWSLLLGGLLGAILAVPLTASVKVLFQRYVWLAKLAPQTVGGARGGR